MLDVSQSLRTTQISIMLRECQNRRERWIRWIAACRQDSLKVMRDTRICSIYFERSLAPTQLNPVPSIFAFPQHLRWKPPKSRTYLEERRQKQWKETPQTTRSRKVFTSRKKQDVNSFERGIFCFWRSQYSLLLARVPWWSGLNWFNSLRNRSKLSIMASPWAFADKSKSFSRRLFARLIVSTFSTQVHSFWRN